MTVANSNLRVVMYDPGNFLPYYVDALCRSLSALGIRVRVITSPPLFETVGDDGLYRTDRFFFPSLRGVARALVRRRRTLRRAVKGLAYPMGVLRTWHALRRGPPGVLHLQWAPVPALDALLVRALKARGWRVLHAVHDPLPAPSRRLAFRSHRALLRLADAMIVHTPQQRAEVIRILPELTERVRVVAHGGDRFPLPTAAERARHRERLRIEAGRELLLSFGMIKPYKGLEYLLAAMPDVIARFPRVVLVIAGEPLMSLRGLERQIDALRLHDHVSLRPGFVPAHEVPSYFRAADLLVTPYTSIGASGVVVMAQGHGLPAVVTRVGGLPEFVERDVCGIVVAPRAPDALSDGICRALGDRAELTAMGVRAWERLARENAWSDVAERTVALYAGPSAPTGRDTADHALRVVSHP
jgi:glycosyltransferase involved in cell wall biosynthesis